MSEVFEQKFVILALVKKDDGTFLIQRRYAPDVPDAHDKWEIVGGKVDYDETPQQTVVREVKEETGFDVAIEQMVPEVHMERWTRTDGSRFRVILIPFVTRIVGGTHLTENLKEKVSESKFITKAEIGQYDWITEVDPSIASRFG